LEWNGLTRFATALFATLAFPELNRPFAAPPIPR
jgi:hypothetical protein